MQMNKGYTKRKILAWRKGRTVPTLDLIAREEPLEIRLNGIPAGLLMQTPGDEKALAVGYLYTEGLIEDIREVELIRHCGSGLDPFLTSSVVEVQVKRDISGTLSKRPLEWTRSSCGLCSKDAVAEIVRHIKPVKTPLSVTWEIIRGISAKIEKAQSLFRKTGGTHAVSLVDPSGKILFKGEDVGRHNAMDKVIGKALLARYPMGSVFAFLSGRVSYEMVLKAARAGIPIIAAVSAPTQMAVDLARRLGITLAGFLREEQVNIYTHPRRINF